MLENFVFGAEALAPIFIIIGVGWFLYRLEVIDDAFVDVSSKLVMNVTFPILLILKISELDIRQSIDVIDIGIIYFVFISIYLISWLFGHLTKISRHELGAFIQGSVRGNFGIIGLAISSNLYGEAGLAIAALYLAFLIPLYNVLSVIALSKSTNQTSKTSIFGFVKKIILNPLIIAIIIGAILAIFSIKIPEVVAKPADYLSSISLPLALLGIGATLKFKHRDYSIKNTVFACFFKIILMPCLGVLAAITMGVTGVQLAVLFILFSMPTAIVTMPMARSMGADYKLAGSIIVFSSIISIATIASGLTILKTLFDI